jgi:salicylate hydroxylase
MGLTYARGLILFLFFFLSWRRPHKGLSYFPSGGLLTFHRAEFHGMLLNKLPSHCRTFPSKRLESYTQRPGGPIELRFHDGSTATCDILVGADGIKSVVRKRMFREAALEAESQHRNADAAELRNLSETRFSGVLSYRTLIPAARLSSISPQHRVFSSATQVSVRVCLCAGR